MKILLATLLLSGCAAVGSSNQPQPNAPSATVELGKSMLSYGMAKKYLANNVTTQADILKLFGSPNNMTYSTDGRELWIYDQMSSESTTSTDSNNSGISVSGADSNSTIGVATRIGQVSTRQTTGVRTITIILEFDKNSVLQNHSTRSGGY